MSVVAAHQASAARAAARPNFSGLRRVSGPAALTRGSDVSPAVALSVRPPAPAPFPRPNPAAPPPIAPTGRTYPASYPQSIGSSRRGERSVRDFPTPRARARAAAAARPRSEALTRVPSPPTLVAYVRVGGPYRPRSRLRPRVAFGGGHGGHRPLRRRRQLEVQRQHGFHREAGEGAERRRDHRGRRGDLRAPHGVPPQGAEHPGPQVPARRAELLGRRRRRVHRRSRRGDAGGRRRAVGHPRALRAPGAVRRVRRVRGQEDQVRHRQGPFRDGVHRRDARRARGGRHAGRVPEAAAGGGE